MDFLREALRVLMDAIMDAEVIARIGAELSTVNAHPDRLTTATDYAIPASGIPGSDDGMVIPKLREGSYFPRLLEP